MQVDVPNIIEGYTHGYFLMADEQTNTLGWYASRQRALIPLDERFRYPKSLQRILNQEKFRIAINQDFAGVVTGCANRETTWISPELAEVYFVLYEHGWAHSFEAWEGEKLAGGILGIVIGGVFVGESMFYNIPDASKVAMVKLVERLRDRGFLMFDAQIINPHLERFGAYEVELGKYQKLLKKALKCRCQFV
jgi:leucyl/phenylalanyl-tRNA--protein transferase